jgi:hypothetical protein
MHAFMQFGYQVALAALVVGVFIKGADPMRRTVATIFAVMIVSLLCSGLWPTPLYADAMILADAVACLIITWNPAGRWQSVIGLSFILQIGVHVGRLAAVRPDMESYWWGLSGLAVLQLLLIGGWWINDVFLPFYRRWSGHHPLPHSARRSGVG